MAQYDITRKRTNASNRSVNSVVITGYDGYHDCFYPNNVYMSFDMENLSIVCGGVDITDDVISYDTTSEIWVDIPDNLITGNLVMTYGCSGSDAVTGEIQLINMEHCKTNFHTSKIVDNTISGDYVAYSNMGRVFMLVDTNASAYKNANRLALIANDGYGIRKSDVDNGTFDVKNNKLHLVCQYSSKRWYVDATINGFDGLTTVDGVEWYTVAYIEYYTAFNDKYASTNWPMNVTIDSARAGAYFDINGANAIGEKVGVLDGSIFESMTQTVTYNVTNNLTECTTNNPATTIDNTDIYSAVLTANEGYHFNDENVVVTCGEFDVDFTISANRETVTINIEDITGDIYISAVATNELPEYNITTTLSHATNSNDATTIEQGSTYNAVITCDTHYTFTGGILSVSHNNQTITPVYNENGSVATITIPDVQGEIIITGSAIALTHNFSTTLTNCNLYAISGVQTGNKINDGDTVTGTIRVKNLVSPAYSPYYFQRENIHITMNGVEQIYTLSDDNYEVTFTIENVTGDVALNLSATIDNYTLTTNFNNIKNSSVVPTTGVINKTTYIEVVAIANDEYQIKSENVEVTIDGVAVTDLWSLHKQPSSNEYYNYFQMIVTGDNLRRITGDVVITVTATPYKEPVINEDFGFCNVYKPTIEQLADVSKKRFLKGSGQDTSYVDLSQYIYRVYKTYVPDIVISDTQETVKLANYDTQVLSDVVAENPVTIDCGTITLNEEFENVIDYSPFTTLEIHLPFIGIEQLDIDVIRNKEIHLIYTFDVLSAKCLAKLIYNNDVLYQFSGSIADDIPFVATNTGDYNSNVIQTTTESALTLGVNYPYYIITQNIGISPDENIDGKSQYETVKLADVTGLVQVNNINLSTKATEDEKTEIERLLQMGVYINEV